MDRRDRTRIAVRVKVVPCIAANLQRPCDTLLSRTVPMLWSWSQPASTPAPHTEHHTHERRHVRKPMTPSEPPESTDPGLFAEPELCAICGRELWSDGLPPALDGDAWICGDCDAARNFLALDL